MPWIDYRQLRTLIDIAQVLAWMNWQPNQRYGETLRGSCPLCGNASSPTATPQPIDRHFVVALDRQRYKCFRCQQHGDVLDLWAANRKTSLRAAAIELTNLLANPQSSNQKTRPKQPPI